MPVADRKIAERRSEFTAFVVDADFGSGEVHAVSLRAIGYEAKTFPTVDSALQAARSAPPHVAVFNLSALQTVADGFLRGISEISDEILPIILIAADRRLSAIEYVGQGLAFESVLLPMASSLELTQAVDRAASHWLARFEAEAAREDAAKALTRAQTATGDMLEQARVEGAGQALAKINEFALRLAAVRDLEPAVQLFLNALSARFGGAPCLYFRFLPQHLTLAVAQSSGLPIEKVRGVGVDLRRIDPSEAPDRIAAPERWEPLRELLATAFRLDRYVAFPHLLDGEPVGVFALFAEPLAGASAQALAAMRNAFEQTYARNQLLKEKHVLDVFDSGTGLLNRRAFAEELEKEIARARRIFMPVSLICLRMDGFDEDASRGGRARADAAMKVIGAILKKTARTNDFVGRTGPNELMFLLPHADAMGAAMKAERARRAVESMKFAPLEGLGPMTVSIGVSEYPGLAADADGLVKAADEALEQVRKAGGNKVCLATPPHGHQPDFAAKPPPPEQPPPKTRGESP